jgi:hypothetical protein
MTVKMSGTLPAGDGNGLESIVFQLSDATKIHVGICMVSGKTGNTDFESGDTVITARLRRIEIILDPEDRKVAERLMMRALQKRTGHQTLPYDLEEEMRGVFDAFDPAVPDPEEQGTLPDADDPPAEA